MAQRLCSNCGVRMPPYVPRKEGKCPACQIDLRRNYVSAGKENLGVVAVADDSMLVLTVTANEWQHVASSKAPVGLRLMVLAHDSGDGETIYHCPFCGSGQVLARSDRTIECEFCHTCFTVQVQPQYSAFPQTINGVPVEVPGMPGQVAPDPMGGAGMPGEDPALGGAPGDAAPPFGQDPGADPDAGADGPPVDADGDGAPDGDEDDDDPDKGKPAFLKGSSLAVTLQTANGLVLDPADFIRHLALRHATPDERDAALRIIREERANV